MCDEFLVLIMEQSVEALVLQNLVAGMGENVSYMGVPFMIMSERQHKLLM